MDIPEYIIVEKQKAREFYDGLSQAFHRCVNKTLSKILKSNKNDEETNNDLLVVADYIDKQISRIPEKEKEDYLSKTAELGKTIQRLDLGSDFVTDDGLLVAVKMFDREVKSYNNLEGQRAISFMTDISKFCVDACHLLNDKNNANIFIDEVNSVLKEHLGCYLKNDTNTPTSNLSNYAICDLNAKEIVPEMTSSFNK